jgi:hypothetical protein
MPAAVTWRHSGVEPMKTNVLAGALALALMAAGSAGLPLVAQPALAADAAPAAVPAAPKLHAAMRSLWQGHVEGTRAYALAVKANDAKAAKKAGDDVVADAKQIADAVGGFYGADAGKQMLTLLAGHWGGVKAMTDAVHAGDNAARDKALNDLVANGSEISKFLSGANPNLTEDAVRGLLTTHVGHHSAQIGEIMQGDMKAEATTWAAMRAHMDTLADELSGEIAKQFPQKAT